MDNTAANNNNKENRPNGKSASSSSSSSAAYQQPWIEKYRPTQLTDVVGNEETLIRLQAIANDGNLPNLILCGPPGTGKVRNKCLGIHQIESNRIFRCLSVSIGTVASIRMYSFEFILCTRFLLNIYIYIYIYMILINDRQLRSTPSPANCWEARTRKVSSNSTLPMLVALTSSETPSNPLP